MSPIASVGFINRGLPTRPSEKDPPDVGISVVNIFWVCQNMFMLVKQNITASKKKSVFPAGPREAMFFSIHLVIPMDLDFTNRASKKDEILLWVFILVALIKVFYK